MKRTALRRGPGPARRKGLRKVSAKMRKLKPLDDAARDRILGRDGCRCRRCRATWNGWDVSLEVHHVTSRRYKSVRHQDANLVTLCTDCHRWAHQHGKAFRAWWEQQAESRD